MNSAKTAVVVYKGTATGDANYQNGLALALKDGTSGCWKSSMGTKDNDSQPANATTSESGRAITYKQQTYGLRSDNTKESRETWTAFYNSGYNYGVFYPSTKTSPWFLPSLYQWNLMVKTLLGTGLSTSENSNLGYTKINEKIKYAIEETGGSLLTNAAYWTASENSNNRAWCYRATGLSGYNDKTGILHVRPFIAF
jgi:hypothetical protein